MGMFGGLGKAILNQAGINLLGVDFEGQKRARERQAAIQAAALRAAGLLGPAPGQIRQAPIANEDGQDITDAFAPQMEQGPPRTRSPSEVAQGLAALTANTPGFNPKPFADLAQYARPNLMVTPSGEVIDQYDPSNAGRVFPKMGEGIRARPDGGAEAVPGYAGANATIKGAETGAQEQQKAAYDLVDVPMPNGSTVKMPRLMATQILSQHMAQNGSPDGLGVSQSPADKVTAEGNARTAVEQGAAQPQAYAGLQDQARASALARKTIHELLGDTFDPATGKWKGGGSVSPIGGVGDALSGGWTTGYGANLAGINGTKSHDLAAKLETLKAITKVEELQKMRQNSPTGGALGNVSNSENDMLASLRGSLDQGQGSAQFKQQLRSYLNQLDQIAEQRAAAYRSVYGDTVPSPRSAPSADLNQLDQIAEQRAAAYRSVYGDTVPSPRSAPSAGPRTSGFNSRIISGP